MFGYIKPEKNMLLENDLRLYKCLYCGLCSELGRLPPARLTLSYEAVFLFAVLSEVNKEHTNFEKIRCPVNVFSEKYILSESRARQYSSDINIILAYFKLSDDIRDEHSIKAKCAAAALKKSFDTVCKRNADLCVYIKETLDNLLFLENKKSGDTDILSDLFAKILGKIFSPDFIKNQSAKRVLYSFGYNIGKWLYIIDAIDDIPDDYTKKQFNPYFTKYQIQTDENIHDYKTRVYLLEENILTFILNNIYAVFDLLEITEFEGIIKNIIYTVLPSVQYSLKETENDKKILQYIGRIGKRKR